MRKLICGVALVGMVASGVVYAASDNHTTLPEPGSQGCVGQVMAYIAQGHAGAPGPGVGNAASQANLTVQEVRAIAVAYCAGS